MSLPSYPVSCLRRDGLLGLVSRAAARTIPTVTATTPAMPRRRTTLLRDAAAAPVYGGVAIGFGGGWGGWRGGWGGWRGGWRR